MWAPDLTVPAADPSNTGPAILAFSTEVTDARGTVLRHLKLVPYGTLSQKVGNASWTLSGKVDAQEVIRTTQAFQRGSNLKFDFDNQTMLSKDGALSVAGWIKPDSLMAEADGIYADVDWTVAGASQIEKREYRYLAAHVMADKRSGRITRLIGAGLTNSPAVDYPAQASALTPEERAAASAWGLTEAEYLSSKRMMKAGDPVSLLTPEERAAASAWGLTESQFLVARDRYEGR